MNLDRGDVVGSSDEFAKSVSLVSEVESRKRELVILHQPACDLYFVRDQVPARIHRNAAIVRRVHSFVFLLRRDGSACVKHGIWLYIVFDLASLGYPREPRLTGPSVNYPTLGCVEVRLVLVSVGHSQKDGREVAPHKT